MGTEIVRIKHRRSERLDGLKTLKKINEKCFPIIFHFWRKELKIMRTPQNCVSALCMCVCESVVTIAYLSFSFSIWKQEFMMPHQLHDNVMLIENNQNNAQRII